jgi:hypothetical protein
MENKLEIGMYVRFKKEKTTYVRKLLEVIHHFETFDVYRTDKEYFDYEEKDYFDIVCPDEVLKASHNIMDLIEIGDILHCKNDDQYWTVQETQGTGYIQTEWKIAETEEEFFENFDEIITKEQFEQYSYKIGE